MKKIALIAASLALLASPALANDRYKVVRPVIIESGIAGQWITQLSGPVRPRVIRQVERTVQLPRGAYGVNTRRQVLRPARNAADQTQLQAAAYRATPNYQAIPPQFLPQMVEYQTREKPGTIVIDTDQRFLYLVLGNGQARRYGVGVGKPGFEWAGVHKVTRKAEWPDWTPPKEMIEREAAKGHYLPVHMEGGEANPLGARAMYLGSTLYRIHGTNAPWTIGNAVSSGCIRMRNADVVDLYERVKVGTRVIVK